ncbi:MAG: thioredoxin [Pirellulaceae bacterium]|nr:MAG: thioredoxin [Pirellulaceae bacterium]
MNRQEPQGAGTWILNTTAETFQRDVLENSTSQLVLVDFWAPWCQPCRMLAPLLEKLAAEYQGRFLLVKANTDELPEAAAAFAVQSIPAVFAVFDQKVLDGFMGLLPEDTLRQWVSRVVNDVELSLAARWEASDPQRARQVYERILSEQPNASQASIGLARLALASGDTATAQQLLDSLAQRGYLEPEAEKLRAMLDMREKQSLDLDALRQAAEADPDDPAKQIAYAEALAAHNQHEEALQRLLAVVENSQGDVRDQARQAMVEIFHVLPEESPLVATYRRKLAAALY